MQINCKYEKLVPASTLVEHEMNANKHPERQIEMLAKILKYQGWRHPIVVSKLSGKIVAGHGRLEAAKLNGWQEVPVDMQDFDDLAQELAFLASDNKIQELAETDDDKMIELIKSTDIDDLGLFGLDDFELPKDDEERREEIEDEVPDVTESITRLGDIYLLGDHRLVCGDSTDADTVALLMNGEKADMVFTDPPYGDNHAAMDVDPAMHKQGKSIATKRHKISGDEDISFLKDAFFNSSKHLNQKSCQFVFFKWNKWELIKEYCAPFGDPKTVCVWDRNSQAASTFRINPVHEFCFYFGTLGDKRKVGNLRNVWRVQKEFENKELHPTVKPQNLIVPPIEMCSSKGELVLDLFGGSGSTLIACEKTKRKCYMMELDPHYVDVIVTRWCKYTNTVNIKRNGEPMEWTLGQDGQT